MRLWYSAPVGKLPGAPELGDDVFCADIAVGQRRVSAVNVVTRRPWGILLLVEVDRNTKTLGVIDPRGGVHHPTEPAALNWLN